MRRPSIPSVRAWGVKLRDKDGHLVSEGVVMTINRRFAKWEARDLFLTEVGGKKYAETIMDGGRVTVSPL